MTKGYEFDNSVIGPGFGGSVSVCPNVLGANPLDFDWRRGDFRDRSQRTGCNTYPRMVATCYV